MLPTTRNGIVTNLWMQVQPAPNAHAAGVNLCADLRTDVDRHPYIYQFAGSNVLNRFCPFTRTWQLFGTPGLSGTFGAGCAAVYAPSSNFRFIYSPGVDAPNTTSFIENYPLGMLSTNEGAFGRMPWRTTGLKIRVTGLSVGKTEERYIAHNWGSNAMISLSSPLTFVPQTGDYVESLNGAVLMLNAGTVASGSFQSVDTHIVDSVWSGPTSGLPATIGTDGCMLALDEQYVPAGLLPGEGRLAGESTYDSGSLRCMTATATGASSITGTVAGGDSGVAANHYAKYQIRIVEDLSTPAAVGQRRVVASHTAGPSPVYTLGAAWSTTPSSNAKFVIEFPNLAIYKGNNSTTTYTYCYNRDGVNDGTGSMTFDTWSSTYINVNYATPVAGVHVIPMTTTARDAYKANALMTAVYQSGNCGYLHNVHGWSNPRGSFDGTIYSIGGAGASGCLLPGSTNNEWGFQTTYATGGPSACVTALCNLNKFRRYISTQPPWVQSGTAVVGNRLAAVCMRDGNTTYPLVLYQMHLSAVCYVMIPGVFG